MRSAIASASPPKKTSVRSYGMRVSNPRALAACRVPCAAAAGYTRPMRPRIIGRSSSHFTRVARVFAHAYQVAHDLCPAHDLFSQNAGHYGENPALKLPVLVTSEGPWFGALAICRALARLAQRPLRTVWPEQLNDRVASNAQELVLQGMATEVALIMRGAAASDATPFDHKARASLMRSLAWLDAQLPTARRTLDPARDLSFLEVSAYCFVTHLDFRQVVDVSGYLNLQAFCREYGAAPAARATAYRFDDPPEA